MSYSIDDYPLSGKPVEEGSGGEGPPQRGKSDHKNQQQQASPVGVLPQGRHLPENNNPDKQSSHQSSHHQQQQQSTPLEVPSSSGYPQKDDYPENQQTTYNSLQPPSINVSGSSLPGYQSCHQHSQQQQPLVTVPSQVYHPKPNDLSNLHSPNRSHQPVLSIQDPFQPQNLPKNTHRLPSKSSSNTQQEQTSVAAPPKQRNPSKDYPAEAHRDHPEGPNLTHSNFPVKDQPKLQPVPAETNLKVYQQMNSHSLQELTNGYEQRPDPQPRLPEGAVLSRKHLSIPEGFPPPGPPTSPSKLEPRPKKGLLEKICCCC